MVNVSRVLEKGLTHMKICIIIPAYNEEKTIGLLVQSIHKKGFDCYVVDDCSDDSTGQIAKSNGANVLQHNQRQGKGASLRTGFQHAVKLNYDGVIIMDADGQHDTGDIDQFIQCAARNNVGIITGNRMGNSKGMPLLRYMVNHFMSFLISMACRQKIPDTQCGFRFIRCDALKELSLVCNNFEIETEILMKARKKNIKITSVPVRTIYNNEKSKIKPLRDTMRFFAYFLKEIWSIRGK